MLDAVVIGAGPAGVAAALQLRRVDVDFLVFEAGEVGGLVRNARLVENYPAFPRGVRGGALAAALREQLSAAEIEVRRLRVRRVWPDDRGWRLETEDGAAEACRFVIAATGTRPRPLEVAGAAEAAAAGRLVYHVADLASPPERIVVVGGGEVAFDYAINLAERGCATTILVRGRVRAPARLVRLAIERGVEVATAAPVDGIALRGGRVSVATPSGDFEVDMVVAAVGRGPADDSIRHLGSLRVDAWGESRHPGLFACGSLVRPVELRHVAVAVGDGVRAATAVCGRLGR